MGVVEAVERDLEAIRGLAPDLADGTLAAAARRLAEGLDNPKNSLTSRSIATRELRDTMTALRALMPLTEQEDDLARLRQRHADRRAGDART